METVLIVIACMFGIAILLTLGMVNMLVFMALREIIRPQDRSWDAEMAMVEDAGEAGKYEPSSTDEYEQMLSRLMAEVELSDEDIVAGLT